MREELEEKLKRFEQLEAQLVDQEVLSQPHKLTAVAREHGSLARLANKYRRFKQLQDQLQEAKAWAAGDDPDLRELAEAEVPKLLADREALWLELLDMTIGGEDSNRARCIMEIRAGTGGDEAALFAREMYDMYKHHIESKGWRTELIDLSPTELGGFKDVTFTVEGEGAYRELQYESGGHRVQRVPETETKGRIQTSMATVVVLPEPEEVEVDIKPDDYRLDVFRSSGPGGQHVNKTESAVRLTHYETGIVVSCQDEKSQLKNKIKALRVLKARIYEAKQRQLQQERSATRKSLVGSGDRSQRIRTYNFSDNRVTDHRINFTIHKLDQIIAGNVQPLTDAAIEYERQQQRGDMETLD
ncbi:MAG: peptide chain release factor 1 [Planctomycetes bacterium]|nr:peptide chain release factor 1 [Planctomycetota bacterium]